MVTFFIPLEPSVANNPNVPLLFPTPKPRLAPLPNVPSVEPIRPPLYFILLRVLRASVVSLFLFRSTCPPPNGTPIVFSTRKQHRAPAPRANQTEETIVMTPKTSPDETKPRPTNKATPKTRVPTPPTRISIPTAARPNSPRRQKRTQMQMHTAPPKQGSRFVPIGQKRSVTAAGTWKRGPICLYCAPAISDFSVEMAV